MLTNHIFKYIYKKQDLALNNCYILTTIITYTYTRNMIKDNDDFNKRTNTLLHKNISHTLYSRKVWSFCVWEMSWRRGQTAILTQVLLTIAALLPHLGWGRSTVGHWGPQALCRWLSLRHLAPDWLESSVYMVILLFNVHLLPLFFRLFTQVHLLIDGSVEGQYIT